ncbi:MAG: hypothetical protein ACYTEX_27380 [Planctomycetota bacterium]|jgi:hypothetical protein
MAKANEYVPRAGAAGCDWAKGDLVTDGTWNTLDLSAIIPTGTEAVILRVDVQDDSNAGSWIQLQKNKARYNGELAFVVAPVAGQQNQQQVIVQVKSDRTIRYRTNNTTFEVLSLVVQGYFAP